MKQPTMRNAIALGLLGLLPAIAQQPTPAQGRDYLNSIYRVLSVDSAGNLNVNVSAGGSGCVGTAGTPCRVAGVAADGSPVLGAPVQSGGKDTLGNARYFLVDTTGKGIIVGAAANGAAATGNPVLMCGSDGTNCRTLHTDSAGNLVVTQTTPANLQSQVSGPGAAGAAVSGNPVLICGSDGTNCRTLLTDSAGRMVITQTTPANLQAQVSGAGAAGAAVSGNPVLICGSDGTNCRTLHTDSAGNLIITSTSPASLLAQVTGAAANGAAVSGNPVLVCGSDGTNCRSMLTDSSGRLLINQVQVNGATVDTNSGVKSAGTQRFVLATDQPALTTPLPVAPNSTTPATNQVQIYGLGIGGVPAAILPCDERVIIAAGAAATTLIAAGTGGKNIYVCGFSVSPALAGTFKFVSGTGPTCGTGQTSTTGLYTVVASGTVNFGGGLGIVANTNALGDSLCMTTTGAGATMGGVLSFTTI